MKISYRLTKSVGYRTLEFDGEGGGELAGLVLGRANELAGVLLLRGLLRMLSIIDGQITHHFFTDMDKD